MKKYYILLIIFIITHTLFAGRTTFSLNGTWQFEQTEKAFPPKKYTRTIPVPGLVHLAEPKIEQYDNLYAKSKKAQLKTDHKVSDLQYDPKYNWYKKIISIPKTLEGQQAIISIKKSKYVTDVYVNGMSVGSSMECYTPIEFRITPFINFGKKNEIVIRVGDRAWLPSAAAGSTDKEKVNYLPGIWDDVELSFTGNFRVHKALLLPNVADEQVSVKLQLADFYPAQQLYGEQMIDTCSVKINIIDADGNTVVQSKAHSLEIHRDNITRAEFSVPFQNAKLWSPESPTLYSAHIELCDKDGTLQDAVSETFGMRDFERRGKYFFLNGERTYLRGTNITLHRFFEDPDCRHLPWDREWTTKLLAYTKEVGWNGMRVCVGIAPDFWYDIADSLGLLLQNEWLYWQDHGWDEQIRDEYTNWVWSDGNHPSIVIWDAINENWNTYIGNELIPELKKLDPTRVWDAGYMTGDEMVLDEMDEPHPYMRGTWMFDAMDVLKNNPYPLGDLHYWPERWHQEFTSSAAQLVNEYGWIWLWRDGSPSHLTIKNYEYYLGADATPQQRRHMQAYWLQCQTEWLRVNRQLAGIFAFCYLSDNLGFTGDWWMGDVAELNPAPALHWFKHCFAPTGVYIDLVDQRYAKFAEPLQPNSQLAFNLVGVTDKLESVAGTVNIQLYDSDGKIVWQNSTDVTIPAHENKYIPITLATPQTGCYTLIASFTQADKAPVISRRYLQVGDVDAHNYFELDESR